MHMMTKNVFNSNYDTVNYRTCRRLAYHAEDVLIARATSHAATAHMLMIYTTAAYAVSIRDEQDEGAIYILNGEPPRTAPVVVVLVCVRQCRRWVDREGTTNFV
jgi:hypothetical protein